MTVAVDWAVKPQYKETKNSCNKTGHSDIIQFPPLNHKLKKTTGVSQMQILDMKSFLTTKTHYLGPRNIMYTTKLAYR